MILIFKLFWHNGCAQLIFAESDCFRGSLYQTQRRILVTRHMMPFVDFNCFLNLSRKKIWRFRRAAQKIVLLIQNFVYFGLNVISHFTKTKLRVLHQFFLGFDISIEITLFRTSDDSRYSNFIPELRCKTRWILTVGVAVC